MRAEPCRPANPADLGLTRRGALPLAAFALYALLGEARAQHGPRVSADRWIEAQDEIARALSLGQITPLAWMAEVERLAGVVDVAELMATVNRSRLRAAPAGSPNDPAKRNVTFLDASGDNRRLIFNSFLSTDLTPQQILDAIALQDTGHQTRQYGIVNFTGDPVTFTGTGAGLAASGVTGRVQDYIYAIQGNVLVGDEVVLAAEQAFRETKGDMGPRMMASMEAARALGGDGRCSCSVSQPTSCGVPPPGFQKSAHVAVFVAARLGDTNGLCNRIRGCASGDYYLLMNVRDGLTDPDPVFTLQAAYKDWRLGMEGRPDGILSHWSSRKFLPADGVTEETVRIELRDVDNLAITHGGAQVEVVSADGLPTITTPGPVTDLGDGTYSFTLRAGTTTGVDRFVISAQDDAVKATLVPFLSVMSIEPAPLVVGTDELSASAGGALSFLVHEPALPAAEFSLVARLLPESARTARWPLSVDPILPIKRSPFFPSAPGLLDARGRCETELQVPPKLWNALAGRRIEWTGSIYRGFTHRTTNTVTVDVLP